MYPNFPTSCSKNPMDSKLTMKPSTSTTFRLKLEQSTSSSSLSTMTEDYVKSYLQITYQFVFEHCYDLYQQNYPISREYGPHSEDRYPRVDSLKFWDMLITLIAALVEENRKGFDPVLSELMRESNVDQLTATTMWSCLAGDLKCALQEHEQHRLCHCIDYMNLHFRVKNFYNEFVQEAAAYKNIVPEYSSWFEPFIIEWLGTINHNSLRCVHKAFWRDKQDDFPKTSEDVLFSNSVIDIFTQLMEYFKVISELKCPNPGIQQRYLKCFTDIIVKVLTTYIGILCQEFPTDIKGDRIACILLNNVHQLIIQFEELTTKMHNEGLPAAAVTTLNVLEKSLNDSLDELVTIFIHSLKSKIEISIEEVGERLMNIKNSESNQTIQNDIVEAEADRILKPLLDLIDGKISLYAVNLNEIILKKCLKRLWKVVLRIMGTNLTLPFMIDKRMTSTTSMDKAVNKIHNAEIEDMPTVVEALVKNESHGISKKEQKNLFPLQCAILEKSLHILSDYFHAYGNGLRKQFLEQAPELHRLRYTLTFYLQIILRQRENRMSNEKSCLDQGSNDTVTFEELLYEYNLYFEQKVDKKDNSVKLLTQFRYSRADLPMCPSNSPIVIAEPQIVLEKAAQPLTSKQFFQMKIRELLNLSIMSVVMGNCVRACVQSTYHYLFENCGNLYEQEHQTSKKASLVRKHHQPRSGSDKFWYMLISLMIGVIKESKKRYNFALSKIPPELNIGEVTAATMWSLFAVDLKYALEEHKKHKKCDGVDYKNLHYSVKSFYGKYVQKIPPYKGIVPEYSTWFEPFVMTKFK